MLIRCAPKVNGVRPQVNCTCNEKCKYWKECVKETNEPIMYWKEVVPTENEKQVCDTHLNYRGKELIWKWFPKVKGKIKIIAESYVD
ncbi:MAG: hypothetical protein WCR65_02465 [Parcubacteria group bacterium]|jgi:hypothetical protein